MNKTIQQKKTLYNKPIIMSMCMNKLIINYNSIIITVALPVLSILPTYTRRGGHKIISKLFY